MSLVDLLQNGATASADTKSLFARVHHMAYISYDTLSRSCKCISAPLFS